MEINDGIDGGRILYVKGRRWYHQRFDACPHFLFPIAHAEVHREERKPEGTEALHRCCIIGQGKADWYMLEDDNERATRVFLERAEKGEIGFTASLMERWKGDEEEFYEICAEIDRTALHGLSDEELLGLHWRLMGSYMDRCTSSSIIDGFALGGDRVIAGRIRAHLESLGRGEEYDRLFSILTAPVHLSFTNQAELSLLKIAAGIDGDDALRKLFSGGSVESILQELGAHPELERRLSEHQRGHFWIHNNYNDARVLSKGFFIGEIKRLLDEGIDIRHELSYIDGHPGKNKEAKERLMDELNLPIETRALIRYSEDFTHWQDQRKRSTFFATHYLSLLLSEMGRRIGLGLDEMKQLMPTEARLAFAGGIGKDELQERREGFFVFFDEGQASLTTERGAIRELRSYFDRMNIPDGKVEVIKGLCASLGKARGKVRVIKSAKEIGKVEKGEILVAVMTRPDYVMGMKKAAAIVTNEGGISCHAAIVARELRIPCVIATRFATDVLKDGDMVEVDADRGEVRII